MVQASAASPGGSGHAISQCLRARVIVVGGSGLAQELLTAGLAAALAPLLRLLSTAGVDRLSCAALLSCPTRQSLMDARRSTQTANESVLLWLAPVCNAKKRDDMAHPTTPLRFP
jgi:hypothetical protein